MNPAARLRAVTIERCDECGFLGSEHSDAGAIEVAEGLPTRWAHAIAGLTAEETQRRPIDGMWSIAEYTDHVRETAFAMRFVVESLLSTPGIDLGHPPEPRFDPQPRRIDIDHALSGFTAEISQLCTQLRGLAQDLWDATCTIGDEEIDVHWIARHIVHDVTHHLGDVDRLREALGRRLDS